jgi:hypothetical protein
MKKLNKPIPANTKGKQVADLHEIMLAFGFNVSEKEVNEQFFGESTKKAVKLFQKQYSEELEITGNIDDITLKKINSILAKWKDKDDVDDKDKGNGKGKDKGGSNQPRPDRYRAKGHCYDVNEKPLAKAIVKAYDRDLRSEELLGTTKTNEKGYYEIWYTPAKFSKAEIGTADLVVKIENSGGRVLAQSPIYFNVPREATIDLKIGGGDIRGASEYEQLVTGITPLLQNLSLTDLKEDKDYQDITFISNETGKDKSQIAQLVLANLIASQTNIQPEVFYCLFRQQIPIQIASYVSSYLNNIDQALTLPQILTRIQNDTIIVNTVNIRLNLQTGINKNIISFTFLVLLDSIIAQFKALQVQLALQQPYLVGKTSLQDLLNVSTATKDQQQTFASMFVQNTGSMKTFWKNLPTQPGFTTQVVDDLKLTLQLGVYTSNHIPLIIYLKQQQQQGVVSSPRNFAKLDVNDWVKILNTDVNGKPIGYPDNTDGRTKQDKTLAFATILTIRFEIRFPTTAFSGRLMKDTASPPILAAKAEMAVFFDTYPQFKLGLNNVDQFFADNVTTQPSDAMKTQLKMVHRLFKVTSTYETAKVLLNDNIHSAQQIYNMGRTNFMAKYGSTGSLGKITSNRIYAKAEFTYASALALYTSYNTAFNQQAIAALPNLQPDPQTVAQIKQIPDLQTLFGSQDFCECIECRSVGSAAAYLVDILQFLKQRQPTNGKSPKDVLFERRPDLGEMELSCANTNTPLPYIDLVCELLEDVVSPPMTPVSKQTTNTADELAANPQYINTAAYDFLGMQVFPFILPFDLWIENARTYLTNLGMNWYQLRDTINGVKAFTALQNYQINDEYLKISDVERQIMTGQYLSKQSWDFWGLRQNANTLPDPLDPTKIVTGDWITVLSYVPMFLHRTGMIYRQLLVLLELNYINPGGAIHIIDAEESGLSHCDTSKFTIQMFKQADLDHIHQFIRLWQKLNCDMWELDKLIMNKQIGNGVLNDDTLLRISQVQQLKDNYSLSYVTIMAFWGDIDAQNYIDYTSDDEPTIYSLYAQLFRNKTVLDIKDIEAFFPEDPATLTGNLSAALIPVSSACTISMSDMNLIFDYLLIDLTTALLNLDNLSKIYRYSQLALTLGITVQQLITLEKLLSPLDPFSTPDQAILFATKVHKILDSSFSIDQLNYLLRNDWLESSGVAPDPVNASTFLTDLRTGLNKIYIETEVSSHPDSNQLAQKLAMLKWDNSLIVQIGTLLNDKTVYSVNIPTLPATPISFPAGINISYDPIQQILSFTGVMTDTEKSNILAVSAISGDPTAPGVVQQFYDAPRNFVISKMQYFVTPVYSTPLIQLPADVQFPTLPVVLNAKISYDSNLKVLNFVGAMSTDEQTALLNADASNDLNFKTAINTLFNAPTTVTPDPENLFMVTNADPNKDDIKIVFDPAKTPTIEDRFRYVVQKLCTYLRKTMSENFVEQDFATTLQISTAISEQLIINFQASPTLTDYRIIQDYNQDNFVLSNNTITADSYPNQFTSYTLLYKISLIVTGLKISNDEWAWWMVNSTALSALAFNKLPLATGTSVPFSQFEVLLDAYTFDNSLPKSSLTFVQFLKDLIDSTLSKDTLRSDIATYTYWDPDDLKQFETLLSLVNPADYRNLTILLNLSTCFKSLTQLGITADKAIAWAVPVFTADLADKVKQAAKAKYDNAQWLTVAKKLQDGIRQNKRDALIGYLLYHPELKGQTWQTIDDLYSYFLIDTEMQACMLTSRIVQANNTVQLFVQRCLMNLEAEVVADTTADQDWLQWQWMKYYRLWQANRLVFLYPENWIVPGLRDDKTPFFKDLENNLLQGEITASLAEDAYLGYLESLDTVARLEVCGTYHQQEYETNLLHVIGRTHSTPPIYYYRNKDLNTNVWSAWSKVDLDITSNHLIPILWNRRLYLFWAIFNEKPHKVQPIPAAQASSSPPSSPLKYWEVQLAWSEFKQNKWLSKKMSMEKLIISDSGNYPKDNFTLKTFILPTGDLEIAFFSSIFTLTWVKEEIDMGLGITYDYYVPQISVSGPSKYAKFVLTGVKDFLQVYSIEKNSPGTDFSQITDDANNILPLTEPVVTLNLPANEVNQDMDFVNTGTGHFSQDNSRFNTFYTNFIANNKNALTSEITLNQADPFSIVIPHQLLQFDSSIPFFFQDVQKSFYITAVKYYQNGYYWVTTPPSNPYNAVVKTDYQFNVFYHPFVDLFIKQLNRWGIDGVLNRTIQVNPNSIYGTPAFDFYNYYLPTNYVDRPYPVEDVDFSIDGSYSIYNWELFFHAPLLIATKLSQNQRFEEAMQWFHYIFNPTNTTSDPAPARYWITKPFFETTQADYLKQRIDQVLAAIATHDPAADDEVRQWRDNPFNPFLVARLRPVAFQKTVVMKYIDNLIAWGDNQFSMNTMETINIATQLYILAAEILGPRPQDIPAQKTSDTKTYNEIEAGLDAFSNAIIDIESLIAPSTVKYSSTGGTQKLPTLQMLYFCIPSNDVLNSYWDTVADRLFKIRNCMNIQGVVQQLPLFQPPINPGLLVKAAAAGVDLSSVLTDLDAPLPFYRFNIMAQKATELCNELKALGGALLSALEKRDAEGLALLRSSLEIKLFDKVRDVKLRQIDDANQNLGAIQASKVIINERFTYYNTIIKINANEQSNIDNLNQAHTYQEIAQGALLTAAVLALIPDIDLGASGFGGTPLAKFKLGGLNFAQAAKLTSDVTSFLALISSNDATMAQIQGGFDRRWDEWQLQKRIAQDELNQVEYQIAAAEIRLDIANKELDNHDTQRDNAQQLDDYMHSKYTNQDLYDWMVGQISNIYFQGYQLAYDMAKKAERCFRHELGLQDSSYIQFGYWDSLKKGLLSGDLLYHDLQRMEAAYLDLNIREFELTKQISLAITDPVSLLKLKENGLCFINLPEMLFDMDYPGHYMRRIKSVSISIPCIAGPYTTVACTLTLVKNSLRINSTLLNGKYPRDTTKNDLRFIDNLGSIQSVATSSAQNDSGLFELNFRDERYLPFEGVGAISSWQLKLNSQFRQFDFKSISDVIIHFKYTARDGGTELGDVASANLLSQINTLALSENKIGLFRVFSAKQEFPNNWYRFLNPTNPVDDQAMLFELSNDRFPFFAQDWTIKSDRLEIVAKVTQPNSSDYKAIMVPPFSTSDIITLTQDSLFGNLHHGVKSMSAVPIGNWTLKVQKAGAADYKSLGPDEIEDILLVVHYKKS